MLPWSNVPSKWADGLRHYSEFNLKGNQVLETTADFHTRFLHFVGRYYLCVFKSYELSITDVHHLQSRLFEKENKFVWGNFYPILMSTHWNTVWSNRQSEDSFPLFLYSVLWQFQFHCKFHVFRSGTQIPVKAMFCDVTPKATHINQSRKLFKKYSPLIDRCKKLVEGRKAKKRSRLGFEPQDLETGNLQCN